MTKKKIEIKLGDLNELKELLGEALSEMTGEQDREMAVIGKVSEKLRLEYVAWRDQKEDLEDEIRYKKEQLEKQMMRELDRLFESKYNAATKKKEWLWEKIKKELNIIGDTDLNINTKTGIVSQYIETIDADEQDKTLN